MMGRLPKIYDRDEDQPQEGNRRRVYNQIVYFYRTTCSPEIIRAIADVKPAITVVEIKECKLDLDENDNATLNFGMLNIDSLKLKITDRDIDFFKAPRRVYLKFEISSINRVICYRFEKISKNDKNERQKYRLVEVTATYLG